MALGERCELSGELRDPGVRLGELRLGLGLGAGGAVALGRKRLHQLGVAGPFDFQLGGQGVNQGVRGGCSGRVGWLAGRFAGVLQGVGDGRGGKVIEKKAKLAEFAENPICKAALAAGRDFMTARDGRRAEKVLVNGAREKVVEMEGLSREMGEWSLLDEVGDMRGARRELDGHEAPARPLDNQVL